MTRSNWMTLGVLGVGGYLLMTNWGGISRLFQSKGSSYQQQLAALDTGAQSSDSGASLAGQAPSLGPQIQAQDFNAALGQLGRTVYSAADPSGQKTTLGIKNCALIWEIGQIGLVKQNIQSGQLTVQGAQPLLANIKQQTTSGSVC